MTNQVLVQSTTSVLTMVSDPDAPKSIDEISAMLSEQEGEFAFKKLPGSSLEGEQNEFAAGEGI